MAKGSAPRHLANLGQNHLIQKAATKQGSAISFDLTSLTPPQRTYSAEIASIQYINGEVYFVFAQRNLLGDALESAISLRMHGFFAEQFLNSIEGMEHPTLLEIVDTVSLKSESIVDITTNPTHIAKLSANIIQAAVSGFESCLDFYQISATTMARKGNSANSVDLMPVARVDIRTTLFLGILEKLKSLRPEFPQH